MNNDKACPTKRMENVQQISLFGRYSDAEMVARLKGIAADPCNPQFVTTNIQPLFNQILRVRKLTLLEDSETPWRKRKLEQFIKDKLWSPSDLLLPNRQSVTKLSPRKRLCSASSMSSLLNSNNAVLCHSERSLFNARSSSFLFTFDSDLPVKQVSTECSFLDDATQCDYPEIPDVTPKVDIDESLSLSTRYIQPSQHSTRILNFTGDNIQRKVVPVGPFFQVDVPEWSDIVNKSTLLTAYDNNPDSYKWLGTRVWPIEIGNLKMRGKQIGRGRPDSCSCASPGFADCNKRHICEKRLVLKCDIGPAFFSWKFDEMGEQVSKSWTQKDQKAFDSILKRRALSNGKDFVKLVLNCLPHKSRKDFVSYYFNVYIPHRMSVDTKLSSMKCIDTDDEDEAEDFNYLGYHKRSDGGTLT